MTISRRQPLLYYLLLIILLQWSTIIGHGAVLYNSNNNYDDAFYQDMNYYDTFANPGNDVGAADADQALLQQRPIDDASIGNEQDEPIQELDIEQTAAQREDDANEQERLTEIDKSEELDVAADEEATHRKREASDDHNAQHQDQEQKAAYICHAQTPEQQACLDAAVKDTKDTIEHVTSLIKRMREHAVSIVKEINELEGDFLGSCKDERPNPNSPRRPSASRGNCKAPYGLQQENESSRNNQNGNENRNDGNNLFPAWLQRGDTGITNNNEGGGNTPNVNTNTNAKPNSNSKGAPTKPRIVINEFGIPIKTDTSDLPPNEFIEQAQYAVHAWKNQIEECKRLLDEAMLHAAQHQSIDSVDSPNTRVQHIIKIVKQPEEGDSLHEDDAAPAAAASITPVRAAKEASSISSSINNNNNNVADDNAALLKARNNLLAALKMSNKNDDKLAVSGESAKAVHGDNNNDADTDINDSTNSKRNEDSKKCRGGDEEKKNRAIPPLLNVLQGMGF